MGKFSPEQVHIELKYELWGIFLCVSGVFVLLSLMGLNMGPVGAFVVRAVRYACGIGALPVSLLMLIIGIRYTAVRKPLVFTLRFVGFILAYVTALAVVHLTVPPFAEILPENLPAAGGLIGGLILFVLRKAFGLVGAMVVLLLLAAYALVLSTEFSFAPLLLWLKDKGRLGWQDARTSWVNAMDRLTENETAATVVPPQTPPFYDQAKDLPDPETPPTREVHAAPAAGNMPEMHPAPAVTTAPAGGSYQLPPYSLLAHSRRSRATHVQKETVDNVKLLEETLESFGVGAKVINISYGPAITRYEIQPAPGVKVSKIVNLADDIALKLAATGVRIEAPIPGKAAVGIEVPNKTITTVPLADTLDSDAFRRADSPLAVGLGKDIAGQVIVTDLAKMPHLLVAGATGSGKSVCINTIITSVLFKARPETVKFLLIDPKVVELSVYNGIPHLLTPVVTDPKKAAAALHWAVQEMERRYNLFAAAGVREISRYNQEMSTAPLPLIVIIIDELADLMMVAPVDVEDAICRLAQMARAAGLHLVLATQRPSVDVITGTIKANIPSRIAFAVSSQVDSRTILDMAGAEKLLGKGDMLFFPVGVPKPIRVQGAFISDDEVEKLVRYVEQQAQPEYTAGVTACEVTADDGHEAEASSRDELLEEAVHLVLEAGQASVSMLQRKFRIGYTRAARLIDTMEEMKIIGPNVGSKAREIIMTSDQVIARYFSHK